MLRGNHLVHVDESVKFNAPSVQSVFLSVKFSANFCNGSLLYSECFRSEETRGTDSVSVTISGKNSEIDSNRFSIHLSWKKCKQNRSQINNTEN